MARLDDVRISDYNDLLRFETALTLDQRLPERSVLDVFVSGAERQPDRIAITMVMTGEPDEEPRRVSYRDLLGLIRRAANLFAELGGTRPGVAYMLPSLVETHVTLWGAETAGYAVPINFLLQPDHIAELLKAAGVKVLVALGPHPALDIWQKALALREELPDLTLVRVAPPGTPAEEGVVDFAAGLMSQPEDRLVFGEPGSGDDVAAYFHTGGTTGAPKLVAHTHHGQLVAALGGAALADLRASDALTANLPLFHVGGTIFCALAPFMAGAELVIMAPGGLRDPAMIRGYWRIVERYKTTLIGGVPTAVGAVLETPIDGADISHVRAGFTGAALLPPAVSKRFRETTGCNLYEVYGMTEASGLIAVDPVAGTCGIGSVGLRLPYTDVAVRQLGADGDLGEVCPPNEIGVVAVTGPNVSPGYRNSDQNVGVFDSNTLDSGDLGYMDETGRIHIAGRSKDLIIRSGHNIDPTMIENAMATHPTVALAAAVGMPDAYAGELPVCYLALRPGCTVEMDDLHAHAQSTIGERPAWPKEIYIVPEIPLTSVGKIYKPSLRCDAAVRLVTRIMHNELGLPGAEVVATAGGPRGMRVTVTLPKSSGSSTADVKKALDAFLFEAVVSVA